jgi:hypothetical protein
MDSKPACQVSSRSKISIIFYKCINLVSMPLNAKDPYGCRKVSNKAEYTQVSTPLSTTGNRDTMAAADAENSRIIDSGRSDMAHYSPSIDLLSHGRFSVRSAINKQLIFTSHHKLH